VAGCHGWRSGCDRRHLDLYSDDPDSQVERLVGLGAEWVRGVTEPDDTYVVLLDAEGNEFCVVAVDSP
jgi:predicted enzyme related to lactoylglutathione lyase